METWREKVELFFGSNLIFLLLSIQKTYGNRFHLHYHTISNDITTTSDYTPGQSPAVGTHMV